MYSPDDIQYALETTSVLYEPDRRIDTFGNTRFEFLLLSELMDSVGQVRIRSGEVEANQPTIIKPEAYSGIEFEGFGDDAERFHQWLQEHGKSWTVADLLEGGMQHGRPLYLAQITHRRRCRCAPGGLNVNVHLWSTAPQILRLYPPPLDEAGDIVIPLSQTIDFRR